MARVACGWRGGWEGGGALRPEEMAGEEGREGEHHAQEEKHPTGEQTCVGVMWSAVMGRAVTG